MVYSKTRAARYRCIVSESDWKDCVIGIIFVHTGKWAGRDDFKHSAWDHTKMNKFMITAMIAFWSWCLCCIAYQKKGQKCFCTTHAACMSISYLVFYLDQSEIPIDISSCSSHSSHSTTGNRRRSRRVGFHSGLEGSGSNYSYSSRWRISRQAVKPMNAMNACQKGGGKKKGMAVSS